LIARAEIGERLGRADAGEQVGRTLKRIQILRDGADLLSRNFLLGSGLLRRISFGRSAAARESRDQ
jgi:hypothetical protein